ncbi:MAG: glutathione S-transferase N-terminal domain-containing protein, partial [Burkholderiales bacterium]
TAVECGVDQKLTLLPTNPHQSTPELIAANPFSKIPALELDNGEVIYESLLICEYFDEMAGGGIVFPKSRAQRLPMLRRHALGNGLMETSVLRRVESVRGKDADRDKNIARQEAITQRALALLENMAPALDNTLDLGNLSFVVALDYLDFRFPGDAWRQGRPALAAWHERYSQRPSLRSTVPTEPK